MTLTFWKIEYFIYAEATVAVDFVFTGLDKQAIEQTKESKVGKNGPKPSWSLKFADHGANFEIFKSLDS